MIKTMAMIALTNPRMVLDMALSPVLGSLDVSTIVQEAQESSGVDATSNLETKARALGGGAWRILLIVGSIAVLLGLGSAGLKLFFSNSSTRNEAKGEILWKLAGAVFFFGVGALVIVLFNVGKQLFT